MNYLIQQLGQQRYEKFINANLSSLAKPQDFAYVIPLKDIQQMRRDDELIDSKQLQDIEEHEHERITSQPKLMQRKNVEKLSTPKYQIKNVQNSGFTERLNESIVKSKEKHYNPVKYEVKKRMKLHQQTAKPDQLIQKAQKVFSKPFARIPSQHNAARTREAETFEQINREVTKEYCEAVKNGAKPKINYQEQLETENVEIRNRHTNIIFGVQDFKNGHEIGLQKFLDDARTKHMKELQNLKDMKRPLREIEAMGSIRRKAYALIQQYEDYKATVSHFSDLNEPLHKKVQYEQQSLKILQETFEAIQTSVRVLRLKESEARSRYEATFFITQYQKKEKVIKKEKYEDASHLVEFIQKLQEKLKNVQNEMIMEKMSEEAVEKQRKMKRWAYILEMCLGGIEAEKLLVERGECSLLEDLQQMRK